MDLPITTVANTSVPNPKPKSAATITKSLPAGWWNISLSGSRDGVMKAINDSSIPDHEKAVLSSRINVMDSKYNFIQLDAHNFIQDGKLDNHSTIIPSVELL